VTPLLIRRGKRESRCRFDYGDKYWAVKGNDLLCKCGSELCKYKTKKLVMETQKRIHKHPK
jgi:hypothetical protein